MDLRFRRGDTGRKARHSHLPAPARRPDTSSVFTHVASPGASTTLSHERSARSPQAGMPARARPPGRPQALPDDAATATLRARRQRRLSLPPRRGADDGALCVDVRPSSSLLGCWADMRSLRSHTRSQRVRLHTADPFRNDSAVRAPDDVGRLCDLFGFFRRALQGRRTMSFATLTYTHTLRSPLVEKHVVSSPQVREARSLCGL